MKPRELLASRRYARALLEVVLETGETAPAALRQELEEAAALIREHRELAEVLTHPGVATEDKKRLLHALWGEGASGLFRRLLDLLAGKERMALLPEVARAFVEMWNAQRGVVEAEAVTAVFLDEEEEQGLAEALGRASGREVELLSTVDVEVLGGVLVKMEGRVYDGTVRGKLRALRELLAGGSRSR